MTRERLERTDANRQATVPLGIVLLAHSDATHVRRLIQALDPFPVFLHCDSRSPAPVYQAMTRDLPKRVKLISRRPTQWAGWGLVAAELDGYRLALERDEITHVAVLSGSDYPVAPTSAISDFVRRQAGQSVLETRRLPIARWGRGGGAWRFQYRFARWHKHPIPIPPPRPVPRGVVLAGGSQFKVLSRHHVAAITRTVNARPDLVRRWRTTWVPDETFVHSLLNTPTFVPQFAAEHIASSVWYTAWGPGRTTSPRWLTVGDLPELRRRAHLSSDVPTLFARKFSTQVDAVVLDEIDRSLRGVERAP